VQVPYVGRYLMLSSVDRRAGGQGVVQFARGNGSAKEYAVKFYTQFEAFYRERDLYMEPCLREMMPATQEIIGNEDAAIRMPTGFVFPPCIVIEKGESLDVWALRERHDFVTVLQVLCHVAERLKVLHAAGWVHRDLKPGNVLRRPEQHSWTLIDFGCTARIGATLPTGQCPAFNTTALCTASRDLILQSYDSRSAVFVYEPLPTAPTPLSAAAAASDNV
jgi:serine/threonine protein kinase